MQLTKNFNSNEFDSPDKPSTGMLMDKKFIETLQKARDIANTPFIITSGYRTIEHNKKVGGVSNSSHLKGKACDIKIKDDQHRHQILRGLILAGFRRIGIAKTYIHVDTDENKNQNRVWMY